MKLGGKVDSLLALVDTAAKTVDRNSLNPILRNVVLDGSGTDCLYVRGTNLLTSVRTHTTGLQVFDPGVVCVPVNVLILALKANAGRDFDLTTEGTNVNLKCGSSKYKLASDDPADFPDFPTVEAAPFEAVGLRPLLGRTMFAVSNQDGRFATSAIRLEVDGGALRTVATDGRMLATAVGDKQDGLPELEPVLLPLDWSGLVASSVSDSVSVAIGERAVYAKVGNAEVVSALPEGNFPEWKDVIPEDSAARCKVNAAELRAAIGRVTFLADDASAPVANFTLRKDTLKVEVAGEGGSKMGSARCAVERTKAPDGDGDYAFALNLSLLAGVLANGGVEEYDWLVDAGNANLLKAPNYRFVVMPVQIRGE